MKLELSLDVVVHTINASTLEGELGRFLSFRPIRPGYWAPGEIFSQTNKQNNKKKKGKLNFLFITQATKPAIFFFCHIIIFLSNSLLLMIGALFLIRCKLYNIICLHWEIHKITTLQYLQKNTLYGIWHLLHSFNIGSFLFSKVFFLSKCSLHCCSYLLFNKGLNLNVFQNSYLILV